MQERCPTSYGRASRHTYCHVIDSDQVMVIYARSYARYSSRRCSSSFTHVRMRPSLSSSTGHNPISSITTRDSFRKHTNKEKRMKAIEKSQISPNRLSPSRSDQRRPDYTVSSACTLRRSPGRCCTHRNSPRRISPSPAEVSCKAVHASQPTIERAAAVSKKK